MSDSKQRVGRRGEELARRRLRTLGYRVIESNYRAKDGEIDIVSEKGGALVFVEVRTRGPSGFGSPEESLTDSKRRHLIAAAHAYLQAAGSEEREWRIDMVAVEYGAGGGVRRVDVIENAVEG